jgi:hypothetical protein
MRWVAVFCVIVGLAGCGPTVVVLRNWNPYAATEACAKGYEAAGWKRTGQY